MTQYLTGLGVVYWEAQLKRDLNKFIAWLEIKGAEMIPLTNEWEVMRYRFAGAVHIVYRNKRGGLTWTGQSDGHFSAFKDQRRPEKIADPKPIKDVLKGWPNAPDPAREPTEDCAEPEARNEPACDNRPPWE